MTPQEIKQIAFKFLDYGTYDFKDAESLDLFCVELASKINKADQADPNMAGFESYKVRARTEPELALEFLRLLKAKLYGISKDATDEHNRATIIFFRELADELHRALAAEHYGVEWTRDIQPGGKL